MANLWNFSVSVRTLTRKFLKLHSCCISEGRRQFLSEAYNCHKIWDQRLLAPILRDIKLDEFYYQLDQTYQQKKVLNAIDIDLFANAVTSDDYLDELEDLLHKLRLTPNTSDTLPSTSHAVIRTLVTFGKYDQLFAILNDRINYGIFPDHYCSCLMIDTFLKEKNYTAAAKVAAFAMLQEDWNNSVLRALALYSCYMYITIQPTDWEEEVKEEKARKAEEDSGEEIKVRVAYIRNPYFDDHFDLVEPQHLIGKTMAWLGMTRFDKVGKTCELVGWCMYRKWEKFEKEVSKIIAEKKPSVFRSGVKIIEEIITRDDESDAVDLESKEKIKTLVKELINSDLLIEDDLHQILNDEVLEAVRDQEQILISEQCRLYKIWEERREELVQSEIEKVDRQLRLHKIEEEKEKLQKKEEELFFFQNEDKIDLLIEDNEKILSQANIKKT